MGLGDWKLEMEVKIQMKMEMKIGVVRWNRMA
jgi:hypothetical protein